MSFFYDSVWVIPELIHIPLHGWQAGNPGGEGGGMVKRVWKFRWEGVYRLENSSSGVIFDRCIKD